MSSTLLLILVLLAACDDDSPGDADADIDADSDHDTTDSGGDADGDGDVVDGDLDDADVTPTVCDELGLRARSFTDADDDDSLYAVAADLTVPTTEGDWNLRDNWTGCETYLFIQDLPRQNTGWPGNVWDRDVPALFARLPTNAHVFFVSTETAAAAREAALGELQVTLDEVLSRIDEPDRSLRAERVHVITDAATLLEGWLGDVMRSPGWGVAIDRFQRIRYLGSYAHYARYDPAREWFAPNLAMAANEAVYYDFEAERDERLEAQGATVIELFEGEVLSDPGWAGTRGHAEATLPDATTMATFDSMELDLYLGCDGDGEFGTCPAWDYIVNLYLCDRDDPDSCDTEIGRWITTYHREGRWVHDISGLLPLLAEGGTRRFAFYTQQPYEVRLSLRLFDQGRGVRPVAAAYLFSGGGFGPEYNDRYEAAEVEIPEDAARVELATVISGHGMQEPGNCAEFCNTTHHFSVNGEENVLDFPLAGTNEGCMQHVNLGTVPNQYGTWWYGRSGWCPGLEVPMVFTDVTDQVDRGATNTFDYQGFFRGAPYPSGGANIVLSSWVVVWR